jgi:hypothetical protein
VKIYCLTIYNENFNFFKKLKLYPVGLGKNNFDSKWLNDKNGFNISAKNQYYGEYTFHYNLWKNHLYKEKINWIGFCTYRRFWLKKKTTVNDYNSLKRNILNYVPHEWNDYDSILCDPIKISRIKKMKIIKNAFFEIIKNPSLLFKDRTNIKEHFDIFHGSNFMNQAIKLLKKNEQNDFIEFLNNDSFNPYNLFICKKLEILQSYYKSIFYWLKLCEEKFGFKNLNGYGKKRIYGFLAERYLSFWFNKYTKSKPWPVGYFDTNNIKK